MVNTILRNNYNKNMIHTCIVKMSDLLNATSSMRSLKCLVLIFNLSIA